MWGLAAMPAPISLCGAHFYVLRATAIMTDRFKPLRACVIAA